MWAFKDFGSIHFPESCGADLRTEELDKYLSISLQRLRISFLEYKRHKKLDNMKGIDNKIQQSYNSLMWSIKMKKSKKTQIVSKTLKEYFENRKRIFAQYYESRPYHKFDFKKNRKFFDGLENMDIREYRHSLKGTKIIHQVSIGYNFLKEKIEAVYAESFAKSYIEYCIQNNCFQDKIISKWSPDFAIKFCTLSDYKELIFIFSQIHRPIKLTKQLLKILHPGCYQQRKGCYTKYFY